MFKIFLWIIIAVLAGALVWLLLPGEGGMEPSPPGDSASGPTAEVPPSSATPPDAASREPAPQTDTPVDTGVGRDVLRLKSGKVLRGTVVSQNADYVDFQAAGSKEVVRYPRTDIAYDTAEREAPAEPPPRPTSPSRPAAPAAGEEENGQPEKSELRMTAQEAQEYELKKRKERHQRDQKRGSGIRAINIARDVREDLEKKSKGEGFDDKGKEE